MWDYRDDAIRLATECPALKRIIKGGAFSER